MSSYQRFRGMSGPGLRGIASAAVLTSAGVIAGCSADIARLEKPSFTVAENASRAPVPSEPVGRRNAGALDRSQQTWSDSGPRGALPPPSTSLEPSTRVAALPAPAQAQPYSPPAAPQVGAVGPSKPFDAPKTAKPATTAPAAAASGQTIEVQQGDSLYAISKRTGVSIAALMDANQLKSPALKPGQKLVVPAVAGARRPLAKTAAATPAPAIAPIATAPIAGAAQPVQAAANGDWSGSYVVKSGDSLYAIARTHKVRSADLQQANGISDPTKVKPGVTLKVPGSGAAAGSAVAAAPTAPIAAAPSAKTAPAQAELPRVVQAPAPGTGSLASPKIINTQPTNTPKGEQVAALGQTATDAAAPAAEAKPVIAPTKTAAAAPAAAASGSMKFRWPAKGKVIAEFGKRPDGTHNDGINVSVPAGTDVHAAEGGTVAYAGSELKGYGNLILVRHDNGWVSAYAHADTMLVKRGDAVKRGQVIAKAGKTGTVDQPQVHFELRQGSKPVDPMPHMEKQ